MKIKSDIRTIRQMFSDDFKFFFRIPAYQRGYAWEDNQVDEFLTDLENLIKRDKEHYTGMISVEEVGKDQIKKISDSEFFLSKQGKYTAYFVIDGQQRLTFIILFLSILLNKFGNEITDSERFVRQFLYHKKDEYSNPFNMKFGYIEETQNYKYLKGIIIDKENERDDNVYSKNIKRSKLRIEKWITGNKNKQALFDILVDRLVFDFKLYEESESDDIYIIFETTNKRGKRLTNLELLKNRLMYLATLKSEDDKKKNLIESISKTWDKVYSILGKFKESKSTLDDEFLREHWTTYHRFDREGEFYAKDLFEKYFTASNYIDSKTIYSEGKTISINENELEIYIQDLNISISNWFYIRNPNHNDTLKNFLDSEEIEFLPEKTIPYYLYKIRQFNMSFFDSIILALLNLYEAEKIQEKEVVYVLQYIEKYYFLLFSISEKKSDTGSYHFSRKASSLYNTLNGKIELEKYDINALIVDIKYFIYETRHISFYNFSNQMSNLFSIIQYEGFYHWKGLKYLLLEFEEKRSGQKKINKKQYEQFKVIKVFPYSKKHSSEYTEEAIPFQLNKSWERQFFRYSDDEKLRLSCSLGNMIIVPETLEIEDNYSFLSLQRILGNSNLVSSKSIIKVESSQWGLEQISERGMELLDFISSNWIDEDYRDKIDFNSELKTKILYLDKFNFIKRNLSTIKLSLMNNNVKVIMKESFNTIQNNWINMLIKGESIKVLSYLLREYSGKINLVYLDPPYRSYYIGNDKYEKFLYEHLVLIRELMADNATIYAQSDQSSSRVMMGQLDEVFDNSNLINQIVLDRNIRRNDGQFGDTYEFILCYAKNAKNFTFNRQYKPYSEDFISQFSKTDANGRRYSLRNFAMPGQGEPKRFGDKIISPPDGHRWIWSQSRIDDGMSKGLIEFNKDGIPLLRRYLDELNGIPVRNIWDDIPRVKPTLTEKNAYIVGQNHELLLERIIKTSSNPNDLVLDCFMGTGTTQAVAMRLGRRFIGSENDKDVANIAKDRLIKLSNDINNNPEEFLLKENNSISTFYTGFNVYELE
jgi:DNA modification methylase/uncharacterized protein with ParB-like and HNH nuclease domain